MAIIRRGSNQLFMSALPPAQSGVQPSSGPAPYVAKAVHFDGATYLENDNLVCATNTYNLSTSFWYRGTQPAGTSRSPYFYGSLFVVDANNDYQIESWIVGSTLDEGDTGKTVAGGFTTELWSPDGASYDWYTSSSGVIVDGNWHHVLFSGDTNLGQGVIFIDDLLAVQFTGLTTGAPPGVPFQMGIGGLSLNCFGDGSGINVIGDVADFWFAPDVSLLSGGTIPTLTRRQFIDADLKPVSPTSFPGAATLFSGDSTTFATNQGTGGAFTVTGILTNASTSPSD